MCPSNSIIKKNPLKEFWTEERCYITELLNEPQSPNISIALARVEIDTTTQLHSLRGVQETYVIKKGLGLLEIDDEQISYKCIQFGQSSSYAVVWLFDNQVGSYSTTSGRGYNSTTAASHSSGATITLLSFPAKLMTQVNIK